MGEGNKKLSKRDPQSNLDLYRERGFLPEGLLNYLALLGWSIAEDRDIFSIAEMVEAFDVADVSANPARFDLKKAEAINATHLRALPVEEFVDAAWSRTWPARAWSTQPPTAEQQRILGRDRTAGPGADDRARPRPSACCGFLFVDGRSSRRRPPPPSSCGAERRRRPGRRHRRAAGAAGVVAPPAIEAALRAALVEGLGLKPRQAFGPVRVAVSGRTVSPPLYESMELLGRERTLARLAAARATPAGDRRGPGGAGAACPTPGRPRPAGPSRGSSHRRPGVPTATATARPDGRGAGRDPAGHTSVRRPPALPAGHAGPGLGVVAAAAGTPAARDRLHGGRQVVVVVVPWLTGVGHRPRPARPRPTRRAAGHQPLAGRRHPGRVAGLGGAHGMGRGWSSSVPGAAALAAVRPVRAGIALGTARRRASGSPARRSWPHPEARARPGRSSLRLAAGGRPPHDPAAVRRGGVPVPRLPGQTSRLDRPPAHRRPRRRGGHRRAVLRRPRARRPRHLPGPLRVRPGRLGRRLADRWSGGRDRAARGQQRASSSSSPAPSATGCHREVPAGPGPVPAGRLLASVGAYVALVAPSRRPAPARDSAPRPSTCARPRAPCRSPPGGAPDPGVVCDPAGAVRYRSSTAPRCEQPMGYGVIGSPTVSGSVSLGSSPGTPARKLHFLWTADHRSLAPSSSGPGRRPLTAVARVRIPSGLRLESPRDPNPGSGALAFPEAGSVQHGATVDVRPGGGL